MTNGLKTHRLIVSLPGTVGEEADHVAANIDRDGGTWLQVPGATAEHILGETLPVGIHLRGHYDNFVRLNLDANNPIGARQLSLYEARQLAGALLNIPGVADAEPTA